MVIDDGASKLLICVSLCISYGFDFFVISDGLGWYLVLSQCLHYFSPSVQHCWKETFSTGHRNTLYGALEFLEVLPKLREALVHLAKKGDNL